MTKIITFWGKVRAGKKRGRILGFPTANVRLRKKIPEGIYIAKTKIDSVWYPSLTFIGEAKTFHEDTYQAETFILSFHKNIYDKWISTRLLKKIRENKKFSSENQLVAEMKKDEKIAENFFASNQ